MRRFLIVPGLFLVIVLCTWHSSAMACGFPQGYNQLREVLAELGEFRELQENKRHERLRILMQRMDHAALDRAIQDMRLEGNANEIQRLLFYTEGLVSGMARVDYDVLNDLLFRISWLEGKACTLPQGWFNRSADGAERGKYVRPVLGFFALCAVLSLLYFCVVIIVEYGRRAIAKQMICQIPARLLFDDDDLDIELIMLGASDCRVIPLDGTVLAWNKLLSASGAVTLIVGHQRLACVDKTIDESHVSFDFESRLEEPELDRLLGLSQITPSQVPLPVFAS